MSNQKFFWSKKCMKKSFAELNETLSIVKLRKLKIVSDDEFEKFIRAMKKMRSDKEITRAEKDMIALIFNKLITIIMKDPTLVAKISKAGDNDE